MEIVQEKRAFSGLVNRNQRADGRIVVLETSGVPLLMKTVNYAAIGVWIVISRPLASAYCNWKLSTTPPRGAVYD
jgi:hypothetical protein